MFVFSHIDFVFSIPPSYNQDHRLLNWFRNQFRAQIIRVEQTIGVKEVDLPRIWAAKPASDVGLDVITAADHDDILGSLEARDPCGRGHNSNLPDDT